MNFVLSGDIVSAINGIADAVEPETLQMEYPKAAGAVIANHGFNLTWIGLVTLICGFIIWKGNKNAIFLAAIVGGLADLAYFIFMDLGGYVNFMPGGLMTYISAAAIIISFYAYFKMKSA
jgi:CHASE2 domain-containing sensor protein